MNRELLRLWLSRKKGVSHEHANLLEDYFGSVEAVYEAAREDYAGISEISPTAQLSLCDKGLDEAKKIQSDCERLGIRILTREDEDFPHTLCKISRPVQVLYTLGTIPKWDEELGIAVVGTRNNSEYGFTAADRIAGALAQVGITIISGMARGIDSVGLRASLKIGGKTIAVMGRGLDEAYPAQNKYLMEDIIKTGLAVSEYPPGVQALAHNFPERNRIISALSDGVLAVESPVKGGTMITARFALDSGRPLFAVPGGIYDERSKGTNELIKMGAIPVTEAEDIIGYYALRIKSLTQPEPPESESEPEQAPVGGEIPQRLEGLDDNSKKVAMLLLEKDMHIEEISARSSLTIAELNTILPLLEISGIVSKQAGNIYKYKIPDKSL